MVMLKAVLYTFLYARQFILNTIIFLPAFLAETVLVWGEQFVQRSVCKDPLSPDKLQLERMSQK